jgi:hypothetical protein
MPKSTRTIVKQRVEQILRIRTLGAEFHDIRQFASEEDPETGRPWNVSDRQLARYCQQADELLDQCIEKDRTKLFNRHLAMRRALYSRAMENGDLRTALSAARDEAALLGLYPGDRKDGQHVNVNIGIATLIPELERAVERLGPGSGQPALEDDSTGSIENLADDFPTADAESIPQEFVDRP